VLTARRTADGFEEIMRIEMDGAARGQAAVEGFGDLGGCPDQYVRVPDGRDAELLVGTDFNPDIADIVLDRRKAAWLMSAR
jgi:hypothetical protein